MKVSVTQENLSRALSAVGRVATTRNQLAVLGNILLQTDSGRLRISATNLEIAATQYIGAKIEQPGAITIPARLVTEFIARLPATTVQLEVVGEHLHITAGTFSSVINGMIAEEFPELPTVDQAEAIELAISAEDFKQAVSQTLVAVSSDMTRPVLTGVLWQTVDEQLVLAATDGYRLAERYLMSIHSQLTAIVPASTLQEVLRSMVEQTDQIRVLFDAVQVCFQTPDMMIVSRLIDGSFPDYRQLIPQQSETTVVIQKDEFSRIVKVASLFARDSGGGVTLQADREQSRISIHSIASEFGENTSEAHATVSQDGRVTLNSRYLIEALAVTEGEQIDFSFSGKLSPCIITQHGTDGNYMHVVMPMKS